ncbi:MAG: plasmid replication protein, CyRepA1 family [Cyanobacteriota bacterium]|nr:plasmid replication protein, CyRepA1 family [Cyanobacteriota bacterium]
MLSTRLKQHHLKEFRASGISDSLIRLNFATADQEDAFALLTYAIPQSELRRNDGRLRDKYLRRYEQLEAGGWTINGLDPNTHWTEKMEWGRLKPDCPRRDWDKVRAGLPRPSKDKVVKYESPAKTPNRVIYLRVDLETWKRVARVNGVRMPSYQIPIDPETGEALGFWEWVQQTPKISITLTEGGKKAAFLLSRGWVAIALPGIYCGTIRDGNTWRLHPDLVPVAREKRNFYILFDYEPRADKARHIVRAALRLGKAIEVEGPSCRIASLPGPEKGIDDWGVAVENRFWAAAAANLPHPRASLSSLWVGLVEGFANNCPPQEAGTALRDLLADALPFKKYCRLLALPKAFNSRADPADLTVEERYLGPHLPPPGQRLIALQAPKGTGKTEWIARYLDRHLRNFDGRRVLILTHRIQLGSALCQRFGLPYLTDRKTFSERDTFGLGLCVNSLHPLSQARFRPEEWSDCIVVIDEIEQVLWHLLDSATCRRDRVEILSDFRQVLQNASQVIVADADLSDLSLNYLKGLLGQRPWILENTYQSPETAWDVTLYQENRPERLVLELIGEIQRGGRPLVLTSSQKHRSKWGTRTLETMLGTLFPERKILRIDSHTVADKTHPAFGALAHLNPLLKEYDLVIASPSIETGVSIDLRGHFTSVWAIATGKQAISTVSQGMARVREPVPRHVWASSHGEFIADGSLDPQQLVQQTQRLARSKRQCLEAHNHLLSLYRADYAGCDFNFQPLSADCWTAMAARINAGALNYREALSELLQREGHRVRATPPGESKAINLAMKKYRDANYHAHALRVAEPERYLDDAEFSALESQIALTEDERETLKHNQIARRYRVPVTQQLVEKDDRGWSPKIQRHYYIGPGREFLGDTLIKSFAADSVSGAVFEPDFAWGNRLEAQVRLWEFLGLDELEGVESILSQDDPIAAPIAQRCRERRAEIKLAFGATISPKGKDIPVLQTMFRTQGRRLVYLARKRNEAGKALRVYSQPVADWLKDDVGKPIKNKRGGIVPVCDGREPVFEAWTVRHTDLRLLAMAQTAEPTETVTHQPITPSPSHPVPPSSHPPAARDWGEENLRAVAEMLSLTQSQEEFEAVFWPRGRPLFPPTILEAALSLLDESKARLIREWLLSRSPPRP